MSWAMLFPGQGSQRAGMLHGLDGRPCEIEIELDPSTGSFEALDTPASLATTEGSQTALFVAGVASASAIARRHPPTYVAGHSVGACAAAVVCGAISPAEGLALVRRRGEIMGRRFPRGYGMTAVSGLPEHEVRQLIDATARPHDRLFVAIVNAPDQIVVAGSHAALGRLAAAERGTQRRLDVPVPSHCELLGSVTTDLIYDLAEVPDRPLRCPYVTNSRARLAHTAREVLDDLAVAVSVELRWVDVIGLLGELGVGLFVEAAPGRVLTNLVRRSLPHSTAIALEDVGPDELGRRLEPTVPN